MKSIKDKNSFKPHLVEIEERPVSPLGRGILWTILILMTLTFLWLFFGKTDIVVSARATVVPVGEVKILQSLTTGVVKKIYVKEGDKVHKGDPVIEIDPTIEETNIEAKKKILLQFELEAAKIRSILDNKPFEIPPGVDPHTAALVTKVYDTALKTIKEQNRQIDEQANQLKEQISTSEIQKVQMEKLYDLGMKEQRRLKTVLDIIAKDDYYKLEKQNLSYASEIDKLDHEIARLKQKLNETNMKRGLIRKDFRNKLYNALLDLEKKIVSYKSEIESIEFRKRKQVITSPVDGIVAKLGVNTIGAVVTPAEKLASIVPDDVPIQLKAIVENKDIGYIKVGMPVAIKIDTFNFQKYGLIDGVVTKIGANAIEDKRKGPVYEVYIKPKQTSLMVEGERKYLMPGMTATAEMKVGKRRIIEFFVYPLIKYFNEGISVR
ncbi:MAG: HlyD family type I secretion periplasmic adaptor subunit [Sulfurospirillum sp.]|nr:MAG: HlyD family type I secretion periplasmic adaptor subunit [Sulfurospirillum sp.]